jgi:putative transcriptional regulator
MKEYRARLNLTQGQLAEAVGARRETIVFLEQGKYNPSLRLAHAVAKKYCTCLWHDKLHMGTGDRLCELCEIRAGETDAM